MTIFLTAVWLFSVALAGWYCYRLGRDAGDRRTEDRYERLLRVEPLNRTRGVPTNTEAAPSSVRRPRFRSGRMSSGVPHREEGNA